MKSPIIPPFVLFALLLLCNLSSQAQLVTTNLLYYLPIIGNANDVSGNGYHATSTATLTTDRFGTANSAYAFNGSAQSIVLPNLPQLRPQLPMSVSFYAMFNQLGSTAFANDLTAYTYSGMWIGTAGDGSVHLNYGDGGTTNSSYRRSKSSNLTVGTGTWHHFVGVIRAWNDMDIYIDCVDAGGFYNGSGGNLFYSGNPAQVGVAAAANQPGGVGYMSGKIDEIAFWDRALDALDVFKICKGALNSLIVGAEAPIEDFRLDVTPNPSTDKIKVSTVGDGNGISGLQIVDIQGRVLREIQWNGSSSIEVSLSGFSTGMYFLKGKSPAGAPFCKKISVI